MRVANRTSKPPSTRARRKSRKSRKSQLRRKSRSAQYAPRNTTNTVAQLIAKDTHFSAMMDHYLSMNNKNFKESEVYESLISRARFDDSLIDHLYDYFEGNDSLELITDLIDRVIKTKHIVYFELLNKERFTLELKVYLISTLQLDVDMARVTITNILKLDDYIIFKVSDSVKTYYGKITKENKPTLVPCDYIISRLSDYCKFWYMNSFCNFALTQPADVFASLISKIQTKKHFLW